MAIKRYNGSIQVTETAKRWNGSQWVAQAVKRWDGHDWVDETAPPVPVYTWDYFTYTTQTTYGYTVPLGYDFMEYVSHGSGNYYEGFIFNSQNGTFTLTGGPYNSDHFNSASMPGYKIDEGTIKEIIFNSYDGSSYLSEYRLYEIYSSYSYTKGIKVGTVTDTNPNKYPDGGIYEYNFTSYYFERA